jgi:hypothetical protein
MKKINGISNITELSVLTPDTESGTETKTNKNLFFTKVETYFKTQKNKMKNKIHINDHSSFIFTKDKSDNYVIEVHDTKSDSIIFKGHYDIIGVFNIHNSVWYWGWNIELVDKKVTDRSKIVRKFANHIKDNINEFSPKEADELYFKTSNGNFYTKLENILPLVKLTMYLTKGIWYMSICHGKDNTICSDDGLHSNDGTIKRVEYIVIRDIMQIN